MNKKLIFAFWGILISQFSYSQEEFVPALEHFEEAYQYESEENYDDAIKEYSAIAPQDTAYGIALITLVETQIKDKRFEDAAENCTKGLYELKEFREFFHSYLIRSLAKDKKYDEAIKASNNAFKEYPNSAKIHYYTAEIYLEKEESDKAIEHLQKAIKANVGYYSAHYKLAWVYGQQGKYTQGLVVAAAYAMIKGPGSSAPFVIDANARNGFEKRFKSDVKDDYKTINSAIESKTFLRPKKQKGNILTPKDKIFIAINNQMEIAIQEFLKSPDSDEFLSAYYKPLIKGMYENSTFYGVFPSIIYSGLDPALKSKKIVTQRASSVKNFQYWVLNTIKDIASATPFIINGKEIEGDKFLETGQLVAIGKTENGKFEGTPKGYWTYLYPSGNIKSEGKYSDGKLTGLWKFYHDDGRLKRAANYSDGKLNGLATYYFDDVETKRYEFNFSDNKRDGSFLVFHRNGTKLEEGTFKEDNLDGSYKEWDENGNLLSEYNFTDGEREGACTNYFSNGKVLTDMNYKEGKRDGDYVKYFDNGNIDEKGQYKDGVAVGKWNGFHYNNEKYNHYELDDAGKLIDTIYYYYTNGNLSRKLTFRDKNMKKGAEINFDIDGKKQSITWYKNDKLNKSEFYNKKGEIFKSYQAAGRSLDYISYHSNGNKNGVGNLNKGKTEGKWTYYDKYGNKTQECEYEYGDQNGWTTHYYPDGEIQSKYFYKDDKKHGKFYNYHRNGKVSTEGWFIDGVRTGDWTFYNKLGNVTDKEYYNKGNTRKYTEDYDVHGKLESRTYFNEQLTTQIDYYNPEGEIYESLIYDKNGNVDYKRTNFLGHKTHEGSTKNGALNGDFTWYFPNGKVKSKTTFKNDNRHGEYVRYHLNGKIAQKVNYVNGEFEGKCTWFYPNGKKETEINYQKGNRHGEAIWYYENGEISQKTIYEYGEKDGKQTDYDPTGEVNTIKFYDNGTIVGFAYVEKLGNETKPFMPENFTGTVKTYYKNGKIASERSYEKGNIHGNMKKYHLNGKLWKENNYYYDEEEGTFKTYYSDGTLESEIEYKDGDVNGMVKFYHKNGKLKSSEKQVIDVLDGDKEIFDINGNKIRTETYYNGILVEIK